jgi:hypothetical protein
MGNKMAGNRSNGQIWLLSSLFLCTLKLFIDKKDVEHTNPTLEEQCDLAILGSY